MINSVIDNIKKIINKMPESRMLLIMAFIVGIGSGVAAVVLKQCIHFFQWILTGWFNTPSDSFLYFIYPGLGMLMALLFVKFFVKDNIGHGVTKVLLAVSKNESKIKSHNMWSSIAASSVTIGFGGSVGAEAPIVYTGAAIGSNVARSLGLSYKNMTILLGCGAAGAVAGIFKAPMAGVLFTFEILLFNMSMSSLLPFVLSSITATTISYLIKSLKTNLPFKEKVENNNIAICYNCLNIFYVDKIKNINGTYRRWIICAMSLGLLIFIFPPLYGEGYQVLTDLLNNRSSDAIGTSFLSNILSDGWLLPIFFIGVFFAKVFSMSLTNAGGGVGGTFGPTLFMGGVFGFIIARLINLSGAQAVPEVNFVLVGMAGLMSGVMQAPLTAIFLIAEITGGYTLLMPLIITSAMAFATIRMYEPYSIYTKRIAKQGNLLTHDSDMAVLTLLKTDELIENDFASIGVDNTLGDLVNVIAHSKRNIFPVLDSKGMIQGIINLNNVREIMFDKSKYSSVKVYSLMKPSPDLVKCDEHMEKCSV